MKNSCGNVVPTFAGACVLALLLAGVAHAVQPLPFVGVVNVPAPLPPAHPAYGTPAPQQQYAPQSADPLPYDWCKLAGIVPQPFIYPPDYATMAAGDRAAINAQYQASIEAYKARCVARYQQAQREQAERERVAAAEREKAERAERQAAAERAAELERQRLAAWQADAPARAAKAERDRLAAQAEADRAAAERERLAIRERERAAKRWAPVGQMELAGRRLMDLVIDTESIRPGIVEYSRAVMFYSWTGTGRDFNGRLERMPSLESAFDCRTGHWWGTVDGSRKPVEVDASSNASLRASYDVVCRGERPSATQARGAE